MKPLTCEMCGSTDVVREEDLYVCRHCGTKYTPEAARKIMIEGPVDVSGSTVKVDTSKGLENLRILARQACEEDDWIGAAKYYETIRLKSPNDWESAFKSAYYKAASCLKEELYSDGTILCNHLHTVMDIVKTSETTAQQIGIVQQLYEYCENFAEKFDSINIDREDLCANLYGSIGDAIFAVFGEDTAFKTISIEAWKKCVRHMRHAMLLNSEYRHQSSNNYDSYIAKLQHYEPSCLKPGMSIGVESFLLNAGIIGIVLLLVYFGFC